MQGGTTRHRFLKCLCDVPRRLGNAEVTRGLVLTRWTGRNVQGFC